MNKSHEKILVTTLNTDITFVVHYPLKNEAVAKTLNFHL